MHSPQSRSTTLPRTAGDFRPSTITLLFIGLMVAALIPVATHRLPPLTDYINHLARAHVINSIGADPDLRRFYAIEWQLIPNLMMDLVVPALHRFVNLYVAGQIFTALAFVAIISGTLALHRSLFGRWSALPLIAIPLLYNGVMLVGVMNYVFGIGLALWGLAAWVALRDRTWPWRMGASTLFVILLYVCHLFAVGLYGVGLLAFELHRLWATRDQPLWLRFADFGASGLPFFSALALLLTAPTWNITDWSPYWEMEGKIDGLLMAVSVYYPHVTYALIGIVVLVAAYALSRRSLHIHPVGWTILGVGTVIYLAMPRALFAAHMADQRLPIALAFMLIACFDLELRDRLARQGFVALLIVLVAARVLEVQVVWDRLSYRTAEFFQSVGSIHRGARVLVVRDYSSVSQEVSDNDLAHAPSLATIERSALVTTAFTVKGKHILRVRGPFRGLVETEDQLPPSVAYFVQAAERDIPGASYFWEQWPGKYDYVYILFTKKGAQCPDRKRLALVYEGPGFQLYRVVRAG